MEVKFSEHEVAGIMKRHRAMMEFIQHVLEIHGVSGNVELLPDMTGYTVKDNNGRSGS